MNINLIKSQTINQLIRYGSIGIINNFFGYILYLFLTFFWFDPKVAISLFYPISAITGYFGHFKYSFSYKGDTGSTLLRYILTYISGYGMNLMMLKILSDKLKISHQFVQLIAIPVVAITIFFMLKFFVFPFNHTKDST